MKQPLILVFQAFHLHHCLLQFLSLAIQLQKHIDLGFENFLVDGLEQIVHSATFVALEDILLLFGNGRHEDNGDMAGFLVLAHQLRDFKTVHLRHLHIKQHQREVVLQRQ